RQQAAEQAQTARESLRHPDLLVEGKVYLRSIGLDCDACHAQVPAPLPARRRPLPAMIASAMGALQAASNRSLGRAPDHRPVAAAVGAACGRGSNGRAATSGDLSERPRGVRKKSSRLPQLLQKASDAGLLPQARQTVFVALLG